jgi:hypothetical protein
MPDLVADRIYPIVPVNKEADVYYEFNREELLDRDTLRAPGAEANELNWDVSTTAYLAEEYALKKLIPQRVMANADSPVRPKISTTLKLEQAIQIDWERRVQAVVQLAATFTTANFTNTAARNVAWNAATGQTPEQDVNGAKTAIRRQSGTKANAMLMSEQVAQALVVWLKASAQTTYSEYLDKSELPPRLWGLETIVAGAVYNSAAEGQAEVLTDVWDDNVLVFHKEPNPSIDQMTLGYTLRARDWRVKTWYDDKRDGDFIEVGVIQDEVLVAAACGFLITATLT